MSNDKTLWSKLSDTAKKAYETLKTEMASLKVEMAETPAPVKLGEAALQDGTGIKYTGDKLDVGSEITIVTADGETPAPEGDLILQDGTTISISIQDGKSVVTAVKPADMNADPNMMKDETTKQVSEMVTKIVEKFEAQFKAQDELIKKYKTELEETKLKLAKVAGSVIKNTEMLIEFGAIETASAIEEPFNPEGKSKKEILANKLK